MNMNNTELHLYLRFNKRQKIKRDARANTSQCEQYGGCWGPSASEGPQKHDLTMSLEYIV
jgi:hypothetical protein